MTNRRFRITAEQFLAHLEFLRARFRSTPCMRLVFRPISFFRRMIWWPSSNTTTSTVLWLVSRAAPSILVFPGRSAFRQSSLQGRDQSESHAWRLLHMPDKFSIKAVKKKHISLGRNFSCFAAHLIEQDLF